MEQTEKADHLGTLIEAVGLEGAWQSVLESPALDDVGRDAVQREIVTRELQRAIETVKTEGMGPPVLELLRLLVALLAPAEAPPAEPEAEPPPADETAAAADVEPATAEPEADDHETAKAAAADESGGGVDDADLWFHQADVAPQRAPLLERTPYVKRP